MTTNIVTPQSVKLATAVCTAAKTTLSDGTNAVLLLTTGLVAGVLYRLTARPRATVTATQLQLYRYDNTNYHLIETATMAAYTMLNTTNPTPTDFGFTETSPLRLNVGESLYVGAAVALAGGIVFTAQYESL